MININDFYSETKGELPDQEQKKVSNFENIIKFILANPTEDGISKTIQTLKNLGLDGDTLDICKLHRNMVINSLEISQ